MVLSRRASLSNVERSESVRADEIRGEFAFDPEESARVVRAVLLPPWLLAVVGVATGGFIFAVAFVAGRVIAPDHPLLVFGVSLAGDAAATALVLIRVRQSTLSRIRTAFARLDDLHGRQSIRLDAAGMEVDSRAGSLTRRWSAFACFAVHGRSVLLLQSDGLNLHVLPMDAFGGDDLVRFLSTLVGQADAAGLRKAMAAAKKASKARG